MLYENETFEDIATLALILWGFTALTFKISSVFFIVIFLIIFCCPWILKYILNKRKNHVKNKRKESEE